MAKIVGVKFNHSPKVYYFAPVEEHYDLGSGVIVETARGTEYGTVVIEVKEVPDESIVSPLKPIKKKANNYEKQKVEENEKKAKKAFEIAEQKIKDNKLDNIMKLIDVEFSFEGNKAVFYFSAPSRVDFRELVKDLASSVKARIELRQIGARDEAKLLGGLAPCGRECCCKGTITDCKKVTIKMAKMQGLSLNPSKISGLCGRLMCCLEYENPHYLETFKKMPKVGSEVITPDGKAIVVSNNMISMMVKTKAENQETYIYKDYPLDQIKVQKANRVDDVDDNSTPDIKKLED